MHSLATFGFVRDQEKLRDQLFWNLQLYNGGKLQKENKKVQKVTKWTF